MKNNASRYSAARSLVVAACFVVGLLACSSNEPLATMNTTKNSTASHSEEYDTTFYNDRVTFGDSLLPAHIDCRAGLIYMVQDTITFAQFQGTICCIDGPTDAVPGDTLTFFYNSDLVVPGAVFTWSVYEGDLTLISEQNQQSATFVCGGTFSGGKILGGCNSPSEYDGVTTYLECTDSEPIALGSVSAKP